MHRTKQPEQLFNRVISRGRKGVEELQRYLSSILFEETEKEAISSYFASQSATRLNEASTVVLIDALEIAVLSLQHQRLIQAILRFFSYPSQVVVLQALSAMYTILNCIEGMPILLETFKHLYPLITHLQAEIRLAATFLSHTLKQMICDSPRSYQIEPFMRLVSGYMPAANRIGKEFLIEWIMTLQELGPTIAYLAFFAGELFRNFNYGKAQECLKKYIGAAREKYACILDVPRLLDIILKYTKEDATCLHAYQWLEVFTEIFARGCCQKRDQHEQLIHALFLRQFKPILTVVLTGVGHQNQEVKKIAMKVDDVLVSVFPLLQKCPLEELPYRNCGRMEAILRWVNLMYGKSSENINVLISQLVEKLVIYNTFCMLGQSPILKEHFQLLIETLLSHFYTYTALPPQPILFQIIELCNSKDHMLAICRRICSFGDVEFKRRLMDVVVELVVTHPSLTVFRGELKESDELFGSMFQCFLIHEPALLLFGLLTQRYRLVIALIELIAAENTLEMRSFLKNINLLCCKSFNKLNIDLRDSLLARKAYLYIAMIIPAGKYLEIITEKIEGVALQLEMQEILLGGREAEEIDRLTNSYKKHVAQREMSFCRENRFNEDSPVKVSLFEL